VLAEDGPSPFDAWLDLRREAVERTIERVTALTEDGVLSVSRVTVAANHLADIADA
jgi:NAD-specific glutamate dehydrogenase